MNDACNIIVLGLDGVGAPWLGPYGNTFGETPGWNRLASESLIFEYCLAASPKLSASCAAFWLSLDSLKRQATLVTDDDAIARDPATEAFDECVLFSRKPVEWLATTLERTHVAQLLASTAELVAEAKSPSLVWMQASGLYGEWDAPYALRQSLVDEEDPDPPRFVQPPRQKLEAGYDPDELLGCMQAHAGQIAAVDWALNEFLDELKSCGALEHSILVATSTRGYALGEHGEIGGDDALHGELLHVPCLVRFPDKRFAAQRSQRILAASEVLNVVAAALNGNDNELQRAIGFEEPIADSLSVAFSQSGANASVRTPCWFMTEATGSNPRLFAKPDDRWEVNEVSSLCRDAVEEMQSLLERFRQAEREQRPFQCELSDLMWRGYDG